MKWFLCIVSTILLWCSPILYAQMPLGADRQPMFGDQTFNPADYPVEITQKLMCNSCMASVIETFKRVPRLKVKVTKKNRRDREILVFEIMERFCSETYFFDYTGFPPAYVKGCDAFLDRYNDDSMVELRLVAGGGEDGKDIAQVVCKEVCETIPEDERITVYRIPPPKGYTGGTGGMGPPPGMEGMMGIPMQYDENGAPILPDGLDDGGMPREGGRRMPPGGMPPPQGMYGGMPPPGMQGGMPPPGMQGGMPPPGMQGGMPPPGMQGGMPPPQGGMYNGGSNGMPPKRPRSPISYSTPGTNSKPIHTISLTNPEKPLVVGGTEEQARRAGVYNEVRNEKNNKPVPKKG